MTATTDKATKTDGPVQHPGENRSNEMRRRLERVEPRTLRTYTPSLAVITQSAGSYHWTADGRRLADFTSGVLVANLGHHPVRWWQRMIDYMQLEGLKEGGEFARAVPLTAYNAITELEIAATERLVACLQGQPGGGRLEHVLWAASGSEAIQKALWAALAQRAGADKIIATRGGFHGKKGLAGAITGSEEDPHRDPRVRFISFPSEECRDIEHRKQPLDLRRYEQELRALHAELGDQICCLVTEPYLGGGGSYHPQHEYLQLLERFCRQHNILFILDEIQSNFGRTGQLFAFSQYGIEPDIVCLGKGMGNGVPVSAAVGPARVFAPLKYGEGSDTWSANPLSCASVLATLDEFEAKDVMERAGELAKVLESGLQRLKDTGIVRYVRGEGCVWGVQCAPCGNATAEQVANACVEACYLGDEQGRAIHLLGPLAGKVIRVSPPLVMPIAEAQEYLDVMFHCFQTVAQRLSD